MLSGGLTIEPESKELRGVYVRATDPDGALVDPTGWQVEVAFARPSARPEAGDWHHAVWLAGVVPARVSGIGDAYQAQLQVGGPDSNAVVELERGRWRAYVRVTAPTETPVISAGELVVA